MPFAMLKSLEVQISQIRIIVDTNEELRSKISSGELSTTSVIDDLYWRRYDYCSAVLRLYASFEVFVIDALQKWLDWIVKNKLPILSESEKAISRYRHGVGEILKRSNETRFSKINLTVLIDGLASLQNKQDSPLGIEPIFATAPNLRFNDVVSVLEALELSDSSAWLNSFPPLQDCCEVFGSTPESFLKDLVERRNEAAHGNKMPDDFWSVALIKDAASFILCLAAAISELIAYKMITIAEIEPPQSENFRPLKKIGEVTEIIKKHNAFIISANAVGLWEGMELLVVTNARCYVALLSSIQLNGHKALAWLPGECEEIGLCIGNLPPKNARIYSLSEIKWL